MINTTIKDPDKNRWIVATDKEFKEAKKKGLYKGLLSLPAKENYLLCPKHIRDLILLVGEEIEKEIIGWHEAGEVDYDKKRFLKKIEQLLYLLEDLYPHYLRQYKVRGKLDYKKWANAMLPFTWLFWPPLRKVKNLVAFPPAVEEFYQGFEQSDIESYTKSNICGICGRKEADSDFPNIIVHEKCAINKGWYRCDWCEWLYPSNKEKCERKPKCKEYDLVKWGTFPYRV